jgi:hypothetical protein
MVNIIIIILLLYRLVILEKVNYIIDMDMQQTLKVEKEKLIVKDLNLHYASQMSQSWIPSHKQNIP